jgi:hypothetical protein
LLPTTLIFQNQIGESLLESYLILVVANFTLEKMGVKVDEIVEVFKKNTKNVVILMKMPYVYIFYR